MFGGHWSGASRNIINLICCMTSQTMQFKDRMTFMSGRSPLCVNNLPSLVAIGIVVADMFLICHMTLKGCVLIAVLKINGFSG